MRRGQQPGPATVGCSCVYVLRRPDGYFYAGSTEAIGDRLKSHRQVKPDVLNKYARDRCVGQIDAWAGWRREPASVWPPLSVFSMATP